MQYETGPQYEPDDEFKRDARLHQSNFRRDVLAVDCDRYGSKLRDEDAKKLLIYYEHLNVRKAKQAKYPNYSKKRDADMLRSEHIPFNLFAPLKYDSELAKAILKIALNLDIETITRVEFEDAPKPNYKYLKDNTAFDTYIEYISSNNDLCGIGIEVKYTEQSYPILKSEKAKIDNPNSTYWNVTKQSGIFLESQLDRLTKDDMRQIWRNHILGISMVQNGDIKQFTSVIVYPSGNKHFKKAIPTYNSLLTDTKKYPLIKCTFEKFIESIPDQRQEIIHWKNYLNMRYIVED